jgi:LPPG:FO 2-phospho-L-lactate transferase
VGAARFLSGLVRRVDAARIRVIVNTGDDEEFYGLHVSPDLDTIVYNLAEVANTEHGWGLAGESFNVIGALARFYGKPWFSLGDRDLATNIYRTNELRAGRSLSDITTKISKAFGVRASVMPMSNDRVRTFVKVRGRPSLPFQEYFVRRRARGVIEGIELRGLEAARPLPAAIRAIRDSAAVILAPSNPFVSLGPILGLPGMTDALRTARARVAAISPIVGGKTIKGPADKMLRGLGHEVSALGVARIYQKFVGVFVLDNADRKYIEPIEKLGMRAVATDTIMANPSRAARLADVVIRALEV